MQPLVYSQSEETCKEVFDLQRDKTKALRTESIVKRKERLEKLRDWIHANRPRIHEAMHADFRKHPVEVDAIEIFHVLTEIKHALSHLYNWTSHKKVDAPLSMLGTQSYIQYEPRGVCLIISPWNYPFSLCVGPLVSAIAAGNAVILKPSELTPQVSAVVKHMVEEVFDPSVVSVVEGGVEISKLLLALPFDHIFFTGSPSIGKIVMKAAAENLASVTLELGGKSPAIITGSATVIEAAQRTAVAKFVNNGQTCVAPDYVLIDEKIATHFTQALIEQTEKLFLEKDQTFKSSPHYCRIINDKHFVRLNTLLQETLAQGATLWYGGQADRQDLFLHPTILTDIPRSCRIMDEEIFGPILPVVTYRTLDDAVAFVNEKPKPLGLYVFSGSQREQRKILTETSSGGVCINDSAIHFLHHNLPFGGVNNSGIGKSHGYYGFLAFSNEKPVLKQRNGLTAIKAFYPPYTKGSKKIMDWFLKLF